MDILYDSLDDDVYGPDHSCAFAAPVRHSVTNNGIRQTDRRGGGK